MARDEGTYVGKEQHSSHQNSQRLDVMVISPKGFWAALQSKHIALGSWVFTLMERTLVPFLPPSPFPFVLRKEAFSSHSSHSLSSAGCVFMIFKLQDFWELG